MFRALLVGAVALCVALAQTNGGDTGWAMYGLDRAETHYSPLHQINAGNVKQLGLAWAADTGSFAGQIEGTPLVVNGTLYGTLPWSMVFASTPARAR